MIFKMNVKPIANIAIVFSMLAIISIDSAYSESITGNISFNKRAPFAGVFYSVKGEQSNQATNVDQLNKQFTKPVFVMNPGANLQFFNSDDIGHNIYANSSDYSVKFDVGLMNPGTELRMDVEWPDEAFVRISCKIHPKMKAYIANLPSDNFTAIEFDRKINEYDFQLDNIGDSDDIFRLWMSGYDTLNIDLNGKQTLSIPITKRGKEYGQLTLSRVN